MEKAITCGVAAIRDHTDRLSRKAAKKLIRRSVMDQIPGDDDLLGGGIGSLVITNESDKIHTECMQRLQSAVESGDWKTILTVCPIRESSALEDIARALRFGKRQEYEQSVRHLLSEDENARRWVCSLFDDLGTQILK